MEKVIEKEKTDSGKMVEENESNKQNIVENTTEYKMQTSRYFRPLSLTGMIVNTIVMDYEKMTVDMHPKKRNKIPVVYYSEIVHVDTIYRFTLMHTIWMILELIAVVMGYFWAILLIPLDIWLGSHWIIKVTLKNGNYTKVYTNSKSEKNEFVKELKDRANIK